MDLYLLAGAYVFCAVAIHKSENKFGLDKSENNSAKLKWLSVLKPVPWSLPHRPVRSLRGRFACSYYGRAMLLGAFNNSMF